MNFTGISKFIYRFFVNTTAAIMQALEKLSNDPRNVVVRPFLWG
jgi:hypothetical protein